MLEIGDMVRDETLPKSYSIGKLVDVKDNHLLVIINGVRYSYSKEAATTFLQYYSLRDDLMAAFGLR